MANSLRASILTKKFAPGEKLPSGNELSAHYGVARMTIQQALRLLREESLIVSRQGSGVFVRERTEKPVGLRPHVERGFQAARVNIDFAGLSGETLHAALTEPLDKVRAGRLTPKSIAIRILVPDTTKPWIIPSRLPDHSDMPEIRERFRKLFARYIGGLTDTVEELAGLGLVDEASVRVRVHDLTPLFKLYLINDEDMFFGLYPAYAHTVKLGGEDVEFLDLGGKDAVLFHHSANEDADATGTQQVAQGRAWFDSIWTDMARERPL